MKNIFLAQMGLYLLCAGQIIAQSRPDSHAPISVMGDHTHAKGEFMVSYRFMQMNMDGNLSGTSSIEDMDIYNDFMVSPQDMIMNMHMLGVMYAVSDKVTLMAMGNYLSSEMDLRMMSGVEFKTQSGGLGDLSLTALVKLSDVLHINAGVSLPTGDIDERDDTPMADDAQLGYPMQLGSGTFDPSIGLAYFQKATQISWGAQSLFKTRWGENSETYTLGDQFDLKGWGAVKMTDMLSLSLSASYFNIGSIDGADPDMDPMMMPLLGTVNSGRSQLDLGIGTNFLVPEGAMAGFRLAVEYKLPVYQDVNGVQIENKEMLIIGLQHALAK